MRFDLITLNLVLAIAETRNITRAAEREHLALAAASKRLKDLETRLGRQPPTKPASRSRLCRPCIKHW
jgi:hypothetical protein